MYIWQQPGWPGFRQDMDRLARPLARARYAQGRLLGRMEALGSEMRAEAALRTLTDDIVKSGGIEGRTLAPDRVRAAIADRLDPDDAGPPARGGHVEGLVEIALDAARDDAAPLTEERLFAWHAALYPTGWSRMRRIRTGTWRDDADGPMEIVSGPAGRERVHYAAPPAGRVADEMAAFLDWFEDARATEPVLAAGIAHLRFLSIYPFEDGNEPIARAITDMALARAERSPGRFYSLSARIAREPGDYHGILEATQTGGLDVTGWQAWFLECLARACADARHTLAPVLAKAAFRQAHARDTLNPRQARILDRLLDGYEGRLTSSKWAGMAGCSQDTANRDIRDLVERGILVRGQAGGRSTSYVLVAGRG